MRKATVACGLCAVLACSGGEPRAAAAVPSDAGAPSIRDAGAQLATSTAAAGAASGVRDAGADVATSAATAGAAPSVRDAGAELAPSAIAVPVIPARTIQPSDIVADGSGHGFFVTDTRLQAVLQLDLERGTNVIVTGCTQEHDFACPGMLVGPGAEFQRPTALALDAKRRRLLVADSLNDGIYTVDLETRTRQLLAGSGPDPYTPRSIALDASGNHAWMLCQGSLAILDFDLDTGNRSLLTGCRTKTVGGVQCPSADLRGHGPALETPQKLVFDATHSRLLVTDVGRDAVIAVDLASGDRSILSGCTEEPNPRCKTFAGMGEPLLGLGEAVIDVTLDRLIVERAGSLFGLDLNSGDRSTLTGRDQEGPSLEYNWAMTLDVANARILLFNEPDLVTVDLKTGARSVLDGPW